MTTDVPAAKKPRRALVWWGAGLMVLGVLVAVTGGALFVRAAGSDVIEALTTPVRGTPVDVTLNLDEGSYVVYEATAQSGSAGALTTTRGRGVTISPSDVTVVNGAGEQIAVEAQSFQETIDRGSVTYTGAVRFTVEESGPHRVTIAGSGRQVLVAPSVLGSFGKAIAWLGLIGVGVLVGFIGLVLLIVGLIRGSKSNKAKAPASRPVAPVAIPLSQPGWYDDPKGEARLRWWDGQQWTDHASP